MHDGCDRKERRCALKAGGRPVASRVPEDQLDVLAGGDEPVLDLLTPQPPPAGLLEVVEIGRLREAALHQISAATAIAPGDGTQALGLGALDQLVLEVPMQRATVHRAGTLAAQCTAAADAFARGVFVGLEALAQAREYDVAGTPARVFTAEHLAAVALQTGRGKDKARLLQFIEAGVLDARQIQAILERHNLVDRWRRFEGQFLRDRP